MMGAPKNNKSRFLFLAIASMLLFALFGCERGSDLSTTAKSNFFTDRRPFNLDIINEDINRLTNGILSNPKDSRLLIARGFIYAALNEFKDAILDLEKAATINPHTDTADPYGPGKNGVHYLLALAYWQSGEARKAIPHFAKVLSTNPNYSRGYYYRGMAKLVLGDRLGAIKDIEQANKLGNERYYVQTLHELRGQGLRERVFATYIICFHPNKPPQSRPFGYIWEIRHEVK